MGQGWAVAIAFALLGWTPVIVDLGLRQVMLIMLVLLAGAQLLVIVIGVSQAACCWAWHWLKPLAWPWLLVLVWQRRISTIASACGVVVLLTLVAMARVGLTPILAYATQVAPSR